MNKEQGPAVKETALVINVLVFLLGLTDAARFILPTETREAFCGHKLVAKFMKRFICVHLLSVTFSVNKLINNILSDIFRLSYLYHGLLGRAL